MSRIFLLVLLLTSISACNKKKRIDSRAMAFDKRATNVFHRNFSEKDSLKYALTFADSAIAIQPDHANFYYTKILILRSLNDFENLIVVYNQIMSLQKNNYVFLLPKGTVFEHLHKTDSAFYYYKSALDQIDQVKWSESMEKEFFRTIIYGVLNDTINFKKSLNYFQKNFSKEKDFELWEQELVKFDRDSYVRDL